MTSNTPDHETSPTEDTLPHDGVRDGSADGDVVAVAAEPGGSTDPGVPVEPVQPASADDVYDGGATASDGFGFSRTDDLSGEEREPYPVGAVDAEPAPATEGPGGEEIVIDYGAHQEPDAGDAEPPLTKPSPEDHHPYPPQALGDPDPVAGAGAAGAGAAGAAGAASVVTTRDRDAGDRAESERIDRSRSEEPAQRPVYVQAPTPPKMKGNRGFGVLIGVLATIVFGALYFVALLLTPLLSGTAVDYAAASVTILTSAAFFIPVIVFFLAWVLLIVILTRAPWWGYVIGGFVVAIITYIGFLGGALIQNAFEVAPSQVPSFLLGQALAPGAVLAFVIAREVPIWFGVWVGKRGRAVRARNVEAREEYERVLEAGPAARA